MAFGLPLRALVAFEAAARLGSFKAAASELGLTPSAVSHQIRILEARLGSRLFARDGRGVIVTPEGKTYAQSINVGLSYIDNATKQLSPAAKRHIVQIGAPPSLASRWIMPRLNEFVALYPEIDLRLNADTRRLDRDQDFNIVFGDADQWDGIALPLLKERIEPLCSEILLNENRTLAPSDLSKYVLISTQYNTQSWSDWFRNNGLKNMESNCRFIQLDPSHLAIDAALRGMGIVLESDLLTETERHDGKLIAPIASLGIDRISYWLLSKASTKLNKSAWAAYKWIASLSNI